jgi:hypothetical protein
MEKPKDRAKPQQPFGDSNKMLIVAGVVVVLIAGVAAASAAGVFSGDTPLPASVRDAPPCTTDADSTPPCGLSASGGSFVVTAAKIDISKANDGGGNLTLTVYHTGLYADSEIYAQITPYGLDDYVQVLREGSSGASNNYTASIPTSFGLVAGQTYEVQVVCLFNGGAQGAVTEELYVALTPSAPP